MAEFLDFFVGCDDAQSAGLAANFRTGWTSAKTVVTVAARATFDVKPVFSMSQSAIAKGLKEKKQQVTSL